MNFKTKFKRLVFLSAAFACFVGSVHAQTASPPSNNSGDQTTSDFPQLMESKKYGWKMQLCGAPTTKASREGLTEKFEIKSANGHFQCLASLTVLPIAVTDIDAREDLLRSIPAQAISIMNTMMKNTKLESVQVDSEKGETQIRVSTVDPVLGEVQVALRLVVQGRRLGMMTASWPKSEDHQFEAQQVLDSLSLEAGAPIESEPSPAAKRNRI